MPIQIYWKFHHQTWEFSNKKKTWYFSYFCSKHRLWVLVRTASLSSFSTDRSNRTSSLCVDGCICYVCFVIVWSRISHSLGVSDDGCVSWLWYFVSIFTYFVIPCVASVVQPVYMKYRVLFSRKKIGCRLLQPSATFSGLSDFFFFFFFFFCIICLQTDLV